MTLQCQTVEIWRTITCEVHRKLYRKSHIIKNTDGFFLNAALSIHEYFSFFSNFGYYLSKNILSKVCHVKFKPLHLRIKAVRLKYCFLRFYIIIYLLVMMNQELFTEFKNLFSLPSSTPSSWHVCAV